MIFDTREFGCTSVNIIIESHYVFLFDKKFFFKYILYI